MATSVHYKCLEAIKAVIDALSLSGPPSYPVVVRNVPIDRFQFWQGITIHPVDNARARGTNQRHDTGYGCQVTLVRTTNQDHTSYGDAQLDHVEKARNKLENTTAIRNAVAECYNSRVEEGDPFDGRSIPKDHLVSTFTVRCWCRESRT